MTISDQTIDYEAEYNNRARVPEHPAVMAGWVRDAADYRATTPYEADIAYGPSPRAVYDLFPAIADAGGPVVLFIHGGYWQALDKSFFSHLAKGPNARGLAVAIPSYDLCPDVTLAAIVNQIRQAALAIWRKTGRKVVVSGHSAGGHLVAMLLATDWQALDPTAPADLVPAGLAISGLFDLIPLIPTSLNLKLGLEPVEAARLSPVTLRPNAGTRLTAVVGGAESSEYLRQSRLIVEKWQPLGCRTLYAGIPGANHFTVIAGLAEAHSELTDFLVALAEE